MQFFPNWIVPILFVVLLINLDVTQTRQNDGPIPPRVVRRWARDFGRKISAITKNVTAINRLAKDYETFGVSVRKVRGELLVQKVAKEMERMLQKKVSAVKKLADAAEKAILTHNHKKDLHFEYFNAKKVIPDTLEKNLPGGAADPSKYRVIHLNEDKRFNDIAVNYSLSTVHVPTNVFDKSDDLVNGIAWSTALDKQFRENAKNDSALLWQYFGSSTGFFRIYPGMVWPRNNVNGNVDMFDCRVRGWYIQAATFPKDMVILLDSSGSMSGRRMSIARSTVGKILDTLSDNDFFNIIKFNKAPGYLDGCLNRTLIQANTDNREYMRKALHDDDIVRTKDVADFEAALIEAFELFDHTKNKSKGTGCYSNKVIMLITDGAPENYEWVFQKYNWGPNNTVFVRVFTYLIGREVSDSRQTRWMACVNKGSPTRISTLADVQENVQKYIKVMSRPTLYEKDKNVAWTPVYLDYIHSLDKNQETQGLQLMTSISQPVFDKRNDTFGGDKLLGVVGTDILISELTRLTSQFMLGVNGYSFVVTNNGYLLFHPDLKPMKWKTKSPKYKSVILTEIEQAKKAEELKISMINRESGSMKIKSKKSYLDMKMAVVRNTNYFYAPVGRADIPFSLAIALPSGYGEAYISAFADISNYDPKHFEGAGVEIAPWSYCENMDKKPKVGRCLDELLKYLEMGKARNATYRKKCTTDMVESLLFDASVTSRIHQSWIGRNTPDKCSYMEGAWCSVDHLIQQGIELLFLSTRTGLTRFMKTSPNLTDPVFLTENMNSMEDLYYKRAADAGRDNIVFTLPLSINNFNDPNLTMVTASTPLFLQKDNDSGVSTVAAVLGYQMKFKMFKDIFLSVVDECPLDKPTSRTKCGRWKCSNPDIECFLVDDNGYVMYARNERAIGWFFGEVVQHDIFSDMIRKKIFKGVSLMNSQGVCEVDVDNQANSTAAILTTPFKWLFYTVSWTLKELAFFIAEWGLLTWFSEYQGVRANTIPMDDGDINAEEYLEKEGDKFTDPEILHWQKLMNRNPGTYSACNRNDMQDYYETPTVEKDCSRNATLYTANYKEMRKSSIIPNCYFCLNYTDHCLGSEEEECMEECLVLGTCDKQYVVEQVEHTNLILVVVDTQCYCEKMDPITTLPDYTYHENDNLCHKLKESKHLQSPDQPCPPMQIDDEETKCGVAATTVSQLLVGIQLMILLVSCLVLS